VTHPAYKHCTVCNSFGRRGGCSSCNRKRAYFPATATPQERFWGRVLKGHDCWLWQGALSSHGYGEFIYEGENWRAHKLAWFFTHGWVPDGLRDMSSVIMHSCDIKRCVNPAHLTIGTQLENMQDKIRKGRAVCWNKGLRKVSNNT
jgi:hypothetical protein